MKTYNRADRLESRRPIPAPIIARNYLSEKEVWAEISLPKSQNLVM